MANPQQIESDLREYLEKSDNLRNADKFQYLKAIFEKHFATEKLDHMLTKRDLFLIISGSKEEFTRQRANPHVSGKEVDKTDLRVLAVIEALVTYLNRNQLLKRLVKIDYTDPSSETDTIED